MPPVRNSLTDAAASMLGTCQGALGQVVWKWVNEKGGLDGDAREIEGRIRSALHDIDAATVAAGSLGPEPTDFGGAVAALKAGKRVARAGWNGKGMWLRYVHPYGDREFTVRENGPVLGYDSGTLLPWIGMHTADNGFVPWLASQTDMLADDWQILD